MFHACATRFDVIENLETFWFLGWTKRGRSDHWVHTTSLLLPAEHRTHATTAALALTVAPSHDKASPPLSVTRARARFTCDRGKRVWPVLCHSKRGQAVFFQHLTRRSAKKMSLRWDAVSFSTVWLKSASTCFRSCSRIPMFNFLKKLILGFVALCFYLIIFV